MLDRLDKRHDRKCQKALKVQPEGSGELISVSGRIYQLLSISADLRLRVGVIRVLALSELFWCLFIFV